MFRVLDNNAEHCAAMTHCTVESAWITKTRAGLPNHAMAEITFANFELVGRAGLERRSARFAREIQRNLGLEPMDDPFLPDIAAPVAAAGGREAVPRASCRPGRRNLAADDYVEYTWHAPTVRLYVGRPTLRAPRPGYRYPDWCRHAMSGVPACIDPMWSHGGARDRRRPSSIF